MSTSVFVFGATGFIAQHIIKLLIAKGHKVVGSVRSSAKGDLLQSLFGAQNFTYEVVTDLLSPGAFDAGLKKHPEVTFFMHTASPVSLSVTDIEAELLRPAVEGTKRALKAVKEYGPRVSNVIITSSIVASMDIAKAKEPNYTISEESWNPITWEGAQENALSGYLGSKKFAERAAWDFFETEKPNYALNTVNPTYVFGPQAFDSEVKEQLNLSSEILNSFVNLAPDSEVPAHDNSFIDVRDVARAHVACFEKGLANQRLLLVSEEFNSQNILDILNSSFESLRGKIPTGTPGGSQVGHWGKVENSKTREILGEFIDLKTSVEDSVAQILQAKGGR